MIKLHETSASDEIVVERLHVRFHLQGVNGFELIRGTSLQRIDVNFQVVLKKTPEVLKNAAGQLRVIFFVEQLKNTRHTQDDADAFARSPGEIGGEPVVFEVIGDEHRHAAGAENLRAREEIATVYLRAARQQITHGQFHEREDGLVRHCGVFFKLRQGAL